MNLKFKAYIYSQQFCNLFQKNSGIMLLLLPCKGAVIEFNLSRQAFSQAAVRWASRRNRLAFMASCSVGCYKSIKADVGQIAPWLLYRFIRCTSMWLTRRRQDAGRRKDEEGLGEGGGLQWVSFRKMTDWNWNTPGSTAIFAGCH